MPRKDPSILLGPADPIPIPPCPPIIESFGNRIESAFESGQIIVTRDDLVCDDFNIDAALDSDVARLEYAGVYYWYRVGGLIGDLNLIIHDIDELANQGGTHAPARFNFLTRTFYLHIGRAEDIHNEYYDALMKIRLFHREAKLDLRKRFYEAWEPVLRLHNKAKHGNLPLFGEHTVDLRLAHMCNLSNADLVDRQTGGKVTVAGGLAKAAERQIKLFTWMGSKLSTLAGRHIEHLNEAVALASGQSNA